MVAIVAGNGLGVSTGSLGVLGSSGQVGAAGFGRNGEDAYVNAATGNLVLRRQDELLIGRGPDTSVLRSYNSQGSFNDDNGDNWRLGFARKAYLTEGAFNAADSKAVRVDEDGAETVYKYDAGRSRYVSDAGGGAFDTLSYNATTRKWTWVDGNSQITENFDESAGGRLTEVADVDLNKLTLAYNAAGLLISIADANAETTFIDYDSAAGKTANITQIRTVNSAAQTLTRVRYEYDANNRLSKVTTDLSPTDNSVADGRAYVTTYTYDGSSRRVASSTQTDGSSLEFTYIQVPAGSGNYRVETVKDVRDAGDVRVTTFTYDVGGTKTRVHDALGHITELEYDSGGQLLSVTAPPAVAGAAPQKISFGYDARGNLVNTTDAKSQSPTYFYTYDDSGNRISERDSAGNTVTRAYGAKNEILRETRYLAADPDGDGAGLPTLPVVTRYVYNASGYLRFTVSAEGRVTQYDYNTGVNAGQVKSRIEYAGALYNVAALAVDRNLIETELTAWVTAMTAANKKIGERTNYTYDARGQLSSESTFAQLDTASLGVAATVATTNYVYSQAGELLQVVDPRGVATVVAGDFTTIYTYDGLGRVLTKQNAAGVLSVNTYNDADRKTTVTFDNNLTTVTTYDASGNAITVAHGNTLNTLGTTRHTYDALGRLRMSTGPTGGRSFYLFDNAGRQVGQVDLTGALTEYLYNANNQVVATFRYAIRLSEDVLAVAASNPGAFNLATAKGQPFTTNASDRLERNIYNGAGQLIKTVDGEGAVTEYSYDGAGRRIQVAQYAALVDLAAIANKMELLSSDAVVPPGSDDRTERFFYDGDGLLRGKLDAEGYLTEYQYDAAGRQIHTISYATATNIGMRAVGAFAQLIPAADALYDQHSYLLYDARGQIEGQVDAEGYLTEWRYDSAGNKINITRYKTRVVYSATATVATLRPAANAEDQIAQYLYNALNQVTQETGLDRTTTTTYSYDRLGRRISSTRSANDVAQARTTQVRYDEFGRVWQELGGVGSAALAALPTAATPAQKDAVWAQYAIVHRYDDANRRTSTSDAAGNRTIYYYDLQGRVTHTINPTGDVQLSVYNAFGEVVATRVFNNRLSTAILPTLNGGLNTSDDLPNVLTEIVSAQTDRLESSNYNRRGEVMGRIDGIDMDTRFTYNAFGEMTSRDARVQSTADVRSLSTFAYDRRGQSRTVVDSAGVLNRTTESVYDAFGRRTQLTDANLRVWTTQYDRLGRVIKTIDPANANRSATYDAFARVLTQTDSLNNATTFTYNTQARSVTVTTPELISTTTVSNRHGQTLSITDGRNNTTTYAYDADGQLTTVTAPPALAGEAARIEGTTYNDLGLAIETTDANGNKVAYAYDAAGRVLTRTVDPAGLALTTTYRYDGQGRCVWVRDANDVWTRTLFDNIGRKTEVIVDPRRGPDWRTDQPEDNPAGLNLRTTYNYDGSTVLTVTEGAGSATAKVTRYTYDALGRLAEEKVDPSGLALTTSYRYDANGNMVAKKSAAGTIAETTTRYVYDSVNRLEYSVDATGAVEKYSYDAEGRRTATIAYLNRISLTVPGPLPDGIAAADINARLTLGSGDVTTRTAYDKDGRAIFSIDGTGALTERTYDKSGNVVRAVAYASRLGALANYELATVRAAAAALPNATLNRTNRSAYDTAGRMIFSVDALNFVTQYFYDPVGNLVSTKNFANAAGALTDGQIPTVVTASPGAGKVLADNARDWSTRRYYDKAGRLVLSADAQYTAQMAAPGVYVTTYQYDDTGRQTGRIRYADRVIFNTTDTLETLQGKLPLTVPASAMTESNIYDRAGRLFESTDDKGTTSRHIHDAVGRVSETTHASGTAEASITRFVFDTAGRLVEETRGYGSAAAATSRYVLDARGNSWQVIDPRGVELAEQDTVWALAERKRLGYVGAGGNAKAASTLGSAERSALLARYTTVSLFDAENRIIQVTDPLGGTIRTTYDALGEAVKVVDQLNSIGYFYFDAAGRATLHVDPEGYAIETTYDAFGGTATIKAYANKASGAYSESVRPTLTPDAARDKLTTIVHDKQGRQVQITDAELFNEYVSYDAFGNQATFTNKLGGVYTYAYDARGKVTKETLPASITTKNASNAAIAVVNAFDYDAFGNLTRKVEAQGAVEQRTTNFKYEGRQITQTGDIVSVFDPSTQTAAADTPTEIRKHDARGNLVEIDVNGAKTFMWYDALNRKVASLSADGGLSTYGYDDAGNLLAEIRYATAVSLPAVPGGAVPTPAASALDRIVYYSYDANGRQLTRTQPNVRVGPLSTDIVDVTMSKVYDAAGNLLQEIDGRGNSIYRYYDKVGRQVAQVDQENFLVAWDYNAGESAIRETKYAGRLSIIPSSVVSVASLIANAGVSADNRITENDLDRMGRIKETRVLNVVSGSLDANGVLTGSVQSARTGYVYNGLGYVTKQTLHTSATVTEVTDKTYDLIGRQTKDQRPAFTDYAATANVRPTTDLEYDGLNNVKRRIERGTNNSVETDDRITLYIYVQGGRLQKQTDATNVVTSYDYDVKGQITRTRIDRKDADNLVYNDATVHFYDAQGRETKREIWSKVGTAGAIPVYVSADRLEAKETAYNLFGDIIAKRTEGGGVQALWQETAEYDNAGRIWRGNTGDGVYKIYIYDANGNAALTVASAGSTFAGLDLDAVMALVTGNQTQLTVSQFDKRNQLIATFETAMNTTQQQHTIGQYIAQNAQSTHGGSADVVVAGQDAAPASPGDQGVAAIGKQGNVVYKPAMKGYDGDQIARGMNVGITLPYDFAELGPGRIRAHISAKVILDNDVVAEFTGNTYAAGGVTSFTASASESHQFYVYYYNRERSTFYYTVTLFKETLEGEVRLSSVTGNADFKDFPTHSRSVDFRSIRVTNQPAGTNKVVMLYRPAGENVGWKVVKMNQMHDASTTPKKMDGWFSLNWSAIPLGTYEFQYLALDDDGKVLNAESGTMRLSASDPTITQTADPIGGMGRVFVDDDGKLHIIDQGPDAAVLKMKYRVTGGNGAWTYIAQPLLPATTYAPKGWFVSELTAGVIPLSNPYEYEIEVRDGDGVDSTVLHKARGTFKARDPNSVSALSQLPIVRFSSQPTNGATLHLSYRILNTGAPYTDKVLLPKIAGSGIFDWDTTTIAPDGGDYILEYSYEVRDAGGILLNKAFGTVQVGDTVAVQGHTNSMIPGIVQIDAPTPRAEQLALYYRLAGSFGAFTAVTPRLVRAAGTTLYSWDPAAVLGTNQSLDLEYYYELYDVNGVQIVVEGDPLTSADDVPLKVSGILNLGAPSTDTKLKWLVSSSANDAITVAKRQVFNAFGEVKQEGALDGDLNFLRVSDYYYNTLGVLIKKENPQTNETLSNGLIRRVRPTTEYTYDLAGRLIAVKDANGYVNRQSWLVGTGVGGVQGQVLKEFRADGSELRQGYDVLGDLRHSIDRVRTGEADTVGRKTSYTYDAMGRLTKLTRPSALVSEEYTYDSVGNRIKHVANAVDAALTDLVDTTYYDALGRVTKTVAPGSATTAYTYSYLNSIKGVGGTQVGGYQKRAEQADGRFYIEHSDVFGRLSWRRDLGGHVFTFRYNTAGWLTGQTSLGGDALPAGYDPLHRLDKNTDSPYSGQNIAYSYYNNGNIKEITDVAMHTATYYEYDLHGNRTREVYKRELQDEDGNFVGSFDYSQNAKVTYDELNRITRILDPRADIRYEYDANGNRRRVLSYYHDGVNGAQAKQDYWYLYDSMNRFTLTMGVLDGGTRALAETDPSKIVIGTTGVKLAYNSAGERTQAIYGEDNHAEQYTYDADGYLTVTKRDTDASVLGQWVNMAIRENDAFGRLKEYEEYNSVGTLKLSRRTTYTGESKIKKQEEWDGAISGGAARTTTFDYYDAIDANNDNHGVLKRMSQTDTDNNTPDVATHYAYEWWDEAKELRVTANPDYNDAPDWKNGDSRFNYDVNGHILQVDDPAARQANLGRSIRYVTNAQGLILERNEVAGGTANSKGVVNGGTVGKRHYFYYVDGKRVGDVGNDANTLMLSRKSYAEQLAQRKPGSVKDQYKNWKPIRSADFDQNYEPINRDYPGSVSYGYTVKAGESLQSIAAAVWGDAAMWYLIADANGLTGNETLIAGQVVTIPNKVTNIHNNSGTFKVYNAAEAMGDTTPTLPDPPPPPRSDRGGCGGLGMILVIIVTMVVAYYTGVYVGPALGTSTAGVMATGAISAAAGSIAGQAVGMAIGMQDKFSWNQVATSAISGGVGAGIGQMAPSLAGPTFGATVGRAIVGNIVTQGISVAAGLQKKFDWRGVAAAGIGSAVGWGVGELIGEAQYGKNWRLSSLDASAATEDPADIYNAWKMVSEDTLGANIRDALSGAAKSAVSSLIKGQKPNWANIAADSFGEFLGDTLTARLAERESVPSASNESIAGPADTLMYEDTLLPTAGDSGIINIAYADGEESDPVVADIHDRFTPHAAHLREVAAGLRDPEERPRLIEDWQENGEESVLGWVRPRVWFMDGAASVLPADWAMSEKGALAMADNLDRAAWMNENYRDILLDQHRKEGLNYLQSAMVTGNYSSLAGDEKAVIVNKLRQLFLVGPNAEYEVLKQNYPIVAEAESQSATATILAAAAGGRALLSLYANTRSITALQERLQSIGVPQSGDPFELDAFNKLSEELLELGMRAERSIRSLGTNGALKLLGRFKFIPKSTLNKWQGSLNRALGEEGELAFDMVFKPMAREDGAGLFREVSDKFKIRGAAGQGIDRSILLNNGRYIDFEIKATRNPALRSDAFSKDQKRGAAYFVRDRLEKIAADPTHLYQAEAKRRLMSGDPVRGYAVVTTNSYSNKIQTDIRIWDSFVTKPNKARGIMKA